MAATGSQLGQSLSDGTFWDLNLNITEPPPSNYSPPQGFLTIDLTINQTCRVIFLDADENPIFPQDFSLHQTLPPTTIHFPGTMNRAQYYSALHHRLELLNLDEFRLPGDDIINNFTEHVIDRVFARSVNNSLHENLAIHVRADLCRVWLKYVRYRTDQSDQYQDDEEIEEYEEEEKEKGLPEYFVSMLSEECAVIAAEEHREVGDCSVCLDGLFPVVGEEEEEEGKKILFESPCGHFFHNECMVKWLRKSDSCPLCRFYILSAIEE